MVSIIVPLIDDYLQLMIADKIRFLKKYPNLIDRIFTTGKRKTLQNLKDFILNKPVKIVIGYPREQATLPCYAIVLSPENEVPIGLGDDEGLYDGYEYEDEPLNPNNDADKVNLAVKQMSNYLDNTYMSSNYRIECWSDNGDLTTYMYAILKWCLWTSRAEMLEKGWVDIKVSGTDLEPVPDYMPIFIYRRSVQLSLMYPNLYYDNLLLIEAYIKVCQNPDKYAFDSKGNLIEISTGDIIIQREYRWILTAHYFQEETGLELCKEIREFSNEDKTWKLVEGEQNGG